MTTENNNDIYWNKSFYLNNQGISMSTNYSNIASIFTVDKIPKPTLQKLQDPGRENYIELCNSMSELVTYLEKIPSHVLFTSYLTNDLKKISKSKRTKVDPRILVLESNFFENYYMKLIYNNTM